MKQITITKDIYHKILDYFDSFDFEMGGALIVKENKIVDFLPLQNFEENKKSSYLFSFEELNELLSPHFDNGCDLGGIIHSHIGGCLSLSKYDKEFFYSFLKENQSYQFLITPIIVFHHHKKQIKWWIFSRDKEPQELFPMILI